MSAGERRDKVDGRLVARTRSRGKPRRNSWSYIPDGLYPVLFEVLGELGLSAVPFLVGVLHLSWREAVTYELEGSQLVSRRGDGTLSARFSLESEELALVASFMDVRPPTGQALSDLVTKTATKAVRERLIDSGQCWARYVAITRGLLSAEGWRLVERCYPDRPDIYRAMGRSRYAAAEGSRPRTTPEVVDAMEEARAAFFAGWQAQLSDSARAAHERLAITKGGARLRRDVPRNTKDPAR